MRIAVFSDIHGNLPAWRACLRQMREWGAERHAFLGDLCGYYFDQLEIFADLRLLQGLVAVRGNHDQIFLDIRRGDETLRKDYALRYGSSMERLLRTNCGELAGWLESLPLTAEVDSAFCVHGSPDAPLTGYLYPDTDAAALAPFRRESILLGHTHYRMHRFAGRTQLLNPGSVGQPRDGKASCWVAWDTETGEVRFVDIPFDSGQITRAIAESGTEPPYLAAILKRIPEAQ